MIIISLWNKLANEFEEQFECLEENTKNYKTFSIPIEKQVTSVDKDGNESVVTVSYILKFIDSARFMGSLLSNLADNLTEGTHKIRCKDCDCVLEHQSVEHNLINYKCWSRNRDYSNKVSAIISSNTINIVFFYLGYNLQYLYKYHPYFWVIR